jgi:hypothetical protein
MVEVIFSRLFFAKGPQENNLPVLARHGPGLPACHVQKGGCLKAHGKVGSNRLAFLDIRMFFDRITGSIRSW